MLYVVFEETAFMMWCLYGGPQGCVMGPLIFPAMETFKKITSKFTLASVNTVFSGSHAFIYT